MDSSASVCSRKWQTFQRAISLSQGGVSLSRGAWGWEERGGTVPNPLGTR